MDFFWSELSLSVNVVFVSDFIACRQALTMLRFVSLVVKFSIKAFVAIKGTKRQIVLDCCHRKVPRLALTLFDAKEMVWNSNNDCTFSHTMYLHTCRHAYSWIDNHFAYTSERDESFLVELHCQTCICEDQLVRQSRIRQYTVPLPPHGSEHPSLPLAWLRNQ